jgi:hypothetical protein
MGILPFVSVGQNAFAAGNCRPAPAQPLDSDKTRGGGTRMPPIGDQAGLKGTDE